MERHLALTIDDLSKDELERIRVSHMLRNCPKCLGPLQASCHLDASLTSGSEFKACPACKIVWKRELQPWVNERGDGMVIAEGTFVYLTALSDCIHGCRLIRLFDGAKGFVNWK